MSTNRPNLLRAWWPAVVWLGLIMGESTDYMSGEHTSGLLYAIVTRLFGEINFADFLVWHHLLRKTGHVIGYAMLGLLLYRGWRATFREMKPWAWKPAVLAWLTTILVATLDEWHQSYIPSRTGTIRDVGLDSAAALVFLLIAYLWLGRWLGRLRRSEPAQQRV